MSRWLALFLAFLIPAAHADGPDAEASAEAVNDYGYLRYSADYVVNADFTNTETNGFEVLLKTRNAVDEWSQVRIGYSEKMEALEILEAYTLTPDGTRHDVPEDKIYSQESYSSASAAMYADRKVRVIVFPNLEPGTRLVYRYRLSRNTPYFPGYFGFWETFGLMTEYADAQVTLSAPADMSMHVHAKDMQGSGRPVVKDGIARWTWRHRNPRPMPSQTWSARAWEYSPYVMASTYPDFAAVGRAYHHKAAEAARVTPAVQARADLITLGIEDRRGQAKAIYEWVARNIRYVAIYLENGGYEPNPADSILANHYGDCKDNAVLLEALLAAKGIASTQVLIGAGQGPTLPPVASLGRFNHAITYIPEFDLYLDATSPHARFGQLPGGDLGAPVVHAATGEVARTPHWDVANNLLRIHQQLRFDADGSMVGTTRFETGAANEMGLRNTFSRVNAQNRKHFENQIVASAGFAGSGRIAPSGDPLDLGKAFGFDYHFSADDHVDFSQPGGMQLADIPYYRSMRFFHTSVTGESNLTPFNCTESMNEELYEITFPDSVPVVAIPRSSRFRNSAGEYSVQWSRNGQTVRAEHRLVQNAVRGHQSICQPEDYPAFRELYQQVRRSFRAQILYGDLGAAHAGG